MTFAEFQATRREATAADFERIDYTSDEATAGYIYADALVIEKVSTAWPPPARARGKYYLLVERSEYISDDLEKLERLLYEAGISLGAIEET